MDGDRTRRTGIGRPNRCEGGGVMESIAADALTAVSHTSGTAEL